MSQLPSPHFPARLPEPALKKQEYAPAPRPDNQALHDQVPHMAAIPTIIIRRGRWKFIQSPHAPRQLYDLWADSGETRNLAASPTHAKLIQIFEEETLQHWDSGKIRKRIQARREKHRAAEKEQTAAWQRAAWAACQLCLKAGS